MQKQKQKNEKRGRWAESFACACLRLKGFSIVARRFRPPYQGTAGSEIDIIAKRRNLFIFVEVKLRKTKEEAILSLTSQQQEGIRETAELFIAQTKTDARALFRFDGFFLSPWRLPLHIADAWRAE